jgi:thiamine-phosphate pyrophosphorylase
VRGLYAIVDLDALDARRLDPIAFTLAVLDAHPVALQLRAKNATPEVTLAMLRALRPLCQNAHVPLVANDRADLAVVAKADIVHIGQTDASPALVRALAPNLRIGISTHTPEQLVSALRAIPDYVAFGPVWSTRSKSAPDPIVGIAGIKQAARILRHHANETGFAPPLVAIGGATLDRVVEIAPYANAVAVISDLIPPPDLTGDDAYDFARARAKQFADAFEDPLALDALELGA